MKTSCLTHTITLPPPGKLPVRVLDPEFLSFTIDTSLLMGGHWWGSSMRMEKGVAQDTVAELRLEDDRLVAYAQALAPAMLRIGGTEADRVWYKPGSKAAAKLFPDAVSSGKPESHEFILKKGLWARLHDFLGKTEMTLLFTVSAGLADRNEDGIWMEDNARKLIAYSASKKHKVAAWEFGNEVNGFPFIYGWKHRVTPAQYARDFARFGLLVRSLDPKSRVVGPASAVWPKIGEPYPIIRKLCKSPSALFLDAVSWHYYPQQSTRGKIATRRAGLRTLLSPRRCDGILRWNEKIADSISLAQRTRAGHASCENWLTETGHALFGGEPDVSDTFASCLWWLDELGLLAREGVSRVFRQSLVGSDYGLLDQKTFSPRPDYFASFLWKKLMGAEVHSVTPPRGKKSRVRSYIHRGEDTTILVINFDRKKSARVVIAGIPAQAAGSTERYLLAPTDGLDSKTVTLNGVPVEDDLVFKWDKRKTREKYRIAAGENGGRADIAWLPPETLIFVRLRADAGRKGGELLPQ